METEKIQFINQTFSSHWTRKIYSHQITVFAVSSQQNFLHFGLIRFNNHQQAIFKKIL